MTWLKKVWDKVRTSWQNYDIKTKLTLLLVLCGMLPMCILFFYIYFYSHSLIASKEYSMADVAMQSASRSMDQLLAEMESCVQEVILFPTVIDSLKNPAQAPSAEWFFQTSEVEQLLRSVSGGKELPISITIVSAGGDNYTNGERNNYYEKLDGELSQAIINLPSPGTMLLTQRTDSIGTLYLTMGKAIKRNNQVIGVVLVDLNASELDKLFPQIDPQHFAIMALNSRDELFYSMGGQELVQELLPKAEYLRNGSDNIIKAAGQRHMYVLSHQPERYTLIALIPLSYIYSDSKLYLVYGILLGLVVIAQMIIYSRTIAHSFSRRIQLLSHSIDSFTEQMTPISLPVGSSDEIGTLTQGFVHMSNQIVQLVEQVKKDEQRKRELELAVLRSQFNPHMLYNTLNTITYLAKLQGVENIQEVSEAFSRLMRTISHNTTEFVTLRQEIEYIRDYITIKKYNLLQDLTLNVTVDESLLEQPIIKLLLQPFAENAIVHGFANMTRSVRLDLNIFCRDSYIHIRLSDNGHGISAEQLAMLLGAIDDSSESSHIGIKNTVRRFKLTYHNDCYFNIESEQELFTTIQLAYPLKQALEVSHAEDIAGG